MNNKKWIWFDLDDTLYDFSRSSLIGLDYIYNKYELGRRFSTKDAWIDCYHRHNSALWNLYNAAMITQQTLRLERFVRPLTEGGFTPGEADALARELDSVYLDQLGATGLLIDGAREMLLQLREKGYGIGLLSNGFVGVQHQKLRSGHIAEFIDCVVLSDDIGVNKPDRRLFDYALQKSGAKAEDSVMVGDNPQTDIEGAVNAGWRAAVLFSSTEPAEGIAGHCGATAIANHLSQIPAIVDDIFASDLRDFSRKSVNQ